MTADGRPFVTTIVSAITADDIQFRTQGTGDHTETFLEIGRAQISVKIDGPGLAGVETALNITRKLKGQALDLRAEQAVRR